MRKLGVPVVFFFLFLTGCALRFGGDSSQSRAFEKNAPVVYVHPLNELDRRSLSLGILAFQVPANASPGQGLAVAGLFRDVLLGKETFHSVKLIEKDYDGNGDAVAIGKENGVDLVLAGRVNYYLNGYELGGDRVDLSVRLLDVRSCNTVWYMQQTVDKAVTYPDKSFSGLVSTAFSGSRVRPQAGAPAAVNMLVRIAEDMSSVVAGELTVSKD